jgi:hypothetical protein
MRRNDDDSDLDEYDRKDVSARGEDNPPTRGRILRALEREAELEFQHAEAHNTGGLEHQKSR